MDEDEIEIDTTENIVYVPISSNDDFHDEDEQFQVMLDESDEVGEVKNARGKHKTPIDDSYDLVLNGFFFILVTNANVYSSIKRKSKEIELSKGSSGNKYGYLKEIHTKHKIKRLKTNSEQSFGKRVKIED